MGLWEGVEGYWDGLEVEVVDRVYSVCSVYSVYSMYSVYSVYSIWGISFESRAWKGVVAQLANALVRANCRAFGGGLYCGG